MVSSITPQYLTSGSMGRQMTSRCHQHSTFIFGMDLHAISSTSILLQFIHIKSISSPLQENMGSYHTRGAKRPRSLSQEEDDSPRPLKRSTRSTQAALIVPDDFRVFLDQYEPDDSPLDQYKDVLNTVSRLSIAGPENNNNQVADAEDKSYCWCEGIQHIRGSKKMYGCDDPDCPIVWYHDLCLNAWEFKMAQKFPLTWICQRCFEARSGLSSLSDQVTSTSGSPMRQQTSSSKGKEPASEDHSTAEEELDEDIPEPEESGADHERSRHARNLSTHVVSGSDNNIDRAVERRKSSTFINTAFHPQTNVSTISRFEQGVTGTPTMTPDDGTASARTRGIAFRLLELAQKYPREIALSGPLGIHNRQAISQVNQSDVVPIFGGFEVMVQTARTLKGTAMVLTRYSLRYEEALNERLPELLLSRRQKEKALAWTTVYLFNLAVHGGVASGEFVLADSLETVDVLEVAYLLEIPTLKTFLAERLVGK